MTILPINTPIRVLIPVSTFQLAFTVHSMGVSLKKICAEFSIDKNNTDLTLNDWDELLAVGQECSLQLEAEHYAMDCPLLTVHIADKEWRNLKLELTFEILHPTRAYQEFIEAVQLQ